MATTRQNNIYNRLQFTKDEFKTLTLYSNQHKIGLSIAERVFVQGERPVDVAKESTRQNVHLHLRGFLCAVNRHKYFTEQPPYSAEEFDTIYKQSDLSAKKKDVMRLLVVHGYTPNRIIEKLSKKYPSLNRKSITTEIRQAEQIFPKWKTLIEELNAEALNINKKSEVLKPNGTQFKTLTPEEFKEALKYTKCDNPKLEFLSRILIQRQSIEQANTEVRQSFPDWRIGESRGVLKQQVITFLSNFDTKESIYHKMPILDENTFDSIMKNYRGSELKLNVAKDYFVNSLNYMALENKYGVPNSFSRELVRYVKDYMTNHLHKYDDSTLRKVNKYFLELKEKMNTPEQSKSSSPEFN